jgi:ubiquinone/menaquinone biosynthesis C-methylase UbiE
LPLVSGGAFLTQLRFMLTSFDVPLLVKRRRLVEWMDDPNADTEELRRSLNLIRRMSRMMCSPLMALHYLKRFSRRWKPGQTIRILDIATGPADTPRAIVAWGRRRGFDVRVVGIDNHPYTAAFAAREGGFDPRLQIIQADALNMPLEDGSFDYVMTTGFLHHLSDEEAAALLRKMDQLATRGVMIADLLRDRRLYWAINTISYQTDAMFRHDAIASVIQAFSRREIMSLRSRAGIGYTGYQWHFGHRFVLAGEKI